MDYLTADDVGDHAADIVSDLSISLSRSDVVQTMLDQYKAFCESEQAQRLNIVHQPPTDEMRLRLLFECLCFCTFCASTICSPLITKRGWLRKKPDDQMIRLFHGALGVALIEESEKQLGASKLREITVVAVDPQLEFGYGQTVDPIDRLEEYRGAFTAQQGNELERFGKWIGKSLDAPHYPILEILGGSFGTPLFQLTNEVLQSAYI